MTATFPVLSNSPRISHPIFTSYFKILTGSWNISEYRYFIYFGTIIIIIIIIIIDTLQRQVLTAIVLHSVEVPSS